MILLPTKSPALKFCKHSCKPSGLNSLITARYTYPVCFCHAKPTTAMNLKLSYCLGSCLAKCTNQPLPHIFSLLSLYLLTARLALTLLVLP